MKNWLAGLPVYAMALFAVAIGFRLFGNVGSAHLLSSLGCIPPTAHCWLTYASGKNEFSSGIPVLPIAIYVTVLAIIYPMVVTA